MTAMREPSQSLALDAAPKVSVALSVFNGGDVLLSAVQSILDQSFRDLELIVLDDGSTDGSVDQLRKIPDSRLRIIQDGVNKGLSGRLNEAIDLARGAYFARMDHDDISHPERIARQFEFMEANHSVSLVGARCVTMNEQERINGVLPGATTHDEICRHLWVGFNLPHPTWFGRIEWFRAYRYVDPGPYCCEDQELLLRASSTSCYHTLPDQLLAYRVRTRTAWRKLWKTRLAWCRVQVSYFLAQGRYHEALLAVGVTIVRVLRDLVGRIVPRGYGAALAPDLVRSWEDLVATKRSRGERTN